MKEDTILEVIAERDKLREEIQKKQEIIEEHSYNEYLLKEIINNLELSEKKLKQEKTEAMMIAIAAVKGICVSCYCCNGDEKNCPEICEYITAIEKLIGKTWEEVKK